MFFNTQEKLYAIFTFNADHVVPSFQAFKFTNYKGNISTPSNYSPNNIQYDPATGLITLPPYKKFKCEAYIKWVSGGSNISYTFSKSLNNDDIIPYSKAGRDPASYTPAIFFIETEQEKYEFYLKNSSTYSVTVQGEPLDGSFVNGVSSSWLFISEL